MYSQSKSNTPLPQKVGSGTTFHAYAENSTIHGISYSCDVSLPRLHRLLWALICAAFFILANFLILRQLNQWNNRPVITSVQTTGTPLFVFSIGSRKQNGVSLLTPVSDSVFIALSDGTFLFSLHGSFKNHQHKAL